MTEDEDRALHLHDFTGLNEKLSLRAGSRCFGQQKLLKFAMALVIDPEILFVEKPSIGKEPCFIEMVFDILHDL